MTLRDRLAGKARRTRTVLVQVTDPGQDLRDRAEKARRDASLAKLAETQLAERGLPQTAAVIEALEQAAADLEAELGTHYAPVELQALAPDQWDALQEPYRLPSGDVDEAALPAMLAACAVDEDLQDEAWWVEQLASPSWTWGERETLRAAVLQVNWFIPSPSLGKG